MLTRDINIAILFVCHVPVLCPNGLTYRHTFFSKINGNHIILVLSVLSTCPNFGRGHSVRERWIQAGYITFAIFDY